MTKRIAPTTNDPGRSRSVAGTVAQRLHFPPALPREAAHDPGESASHRRQVLEDRQESRHRDGARADVAHVARPDLGGAHLRDELCRFGKEGSGQPAADPRDQRDEDERRHDRPGHEHARLPVAQDVADREQRGGELEAQHRVGQHRELRRELAREEEEEAGRELDRRGHRDAPEDPRPRSRRAGGRLQDHGARGPLGVRKLVARVHDEDPAQRDHGREPEHASQEAERHHLQVGRRHAPEKERRDREDRSGGERRGGRSDRLRDVGFQDRAAAAERAEDRHRHDGRRNRGGDGQPDPQPQVRVGGAEDEPEQDARDDGAKGEFVRRQVASSRCGNVSHSSSPSGRVVA